MDGRSHVAPPGQSCQSWEILSILSILRLDSAAGAAARHTFIRSGGAGRGAMQVCSENSPNPPLKSRLADAASCSVLILCAAQRPKRNGQD